MSPFFFENRFHDESIGTYFISWMLVIFYTKLVKVETVWLHKKRELYSFVDGGSIIRSTEGRDDRSNIGKATDDRGGRG